MDWHFQVHQRANEAEKRGTHRSWFVEEPVNHILPPTLGGPKLTTPKGLEKITRSCGL